MFWTAFQGALLLGAIGVVALVLRFRRAGAVQRQQIKWFAYGAALSIPLSLFPEARPYGPYLEFLGTVLLLAGLGIGIFRYRLWDIDRLINRTLVYGLLTAMLGGVYAGAVLVLGQLFGGIGAETPSWAVAGATLAVAALFQPARRRIQQVVDRRFNRRRYNAATTIELSAPACATRSTWTRCRSSCWPWSTRRCSQPGVVVASPIGPGSVVRLIVTGCRVAQLLVPVGGRPSGVRSNRFQSGSMVPT